MNAEKLHLEILNNLSDGVYSVDSDMRITFWNNAAEEITGYKKEEIIGHRYQKEPLNNIDNNGNQLSTAGSSLYATVIDGHHRKNELVLRHKDGHNIHILANIFPLVENDKIVGAIKIFSPKAHVVNYDKLIEQLSDLAMNDQLTGLPNRRKIESFLEYKFHEMRRFQNNFCVIFLDIDNFSQFNNTYGHDTGDEVLRKVGKSIRHIIRKNDLFGRWGGEEFVGIFEIVRDYETELIAEKIRVLIANNEIPYGKDKLSVTASLGVTIAQMDDTIDSVVTRADKLMYQSKHKGKNCITSDV